jgi:hypothetical protein
MFWTRSNSCPPCESTSERNIPPQAAQARAHKQAADNALAMLRQEHEEAMVKQREEHAAELERMLGEQREVYEARVNELQKEREELKALGDYSPEAPRLFGVGMRLEVRDDGGYYIKKLVEGGGAYKSGLVMEGDKVCLHEDFRGFVLSCFGFLHSCISETNIVQKVSKGLCVCFFATRLNKMLPGSDPPGSLMCKGCRRRRQQR